MKMAPSGLFKTLFPAAGSGKSSAIDLANVKAVGIGLSVIGIGAGIKGMVDQNEAEEITAEARESYRAMYNRLHRKASLIKRRLESFTDMKRSIYQNEIKNAAEVLSHYKAIKLSAYQETSIESVQCIKRDIESLECFACEPENALSFLAKSTFLSIPIAGINLAIKGTEAKIQAEKVLAYTQIEIEEMKKSMATMKAIAFRIKEGEHLIHSLVERLSPIISGLETYRFLKKEKPAVYIMKQAEEAVMLTKALKSVIEVDILTSEGLLNGKSGVVFANARMEAIHAA